LSRDGESIENRRRGVFAGGDIVTGAATVILGMGAGRKAALAIDTYFRLEMVMEKKIKTIAVLQLVMALGLILFWVGFLPWEWPGESSALLLRL
jgi:predicted alpha/beta hydrolase